MEITHIPTSQLIPHKNNAHSELRGIDELAATVEYLGIIEPLVVLPADDDGRHTIIAGHRRHAAATQVGLETVPCIVAADRDAADQIVIMLVENLHRDDLTPTEEAKAYEQLALLDWEPERIAKATGRDLERVRHSLTLRKLPDPVQQAADAEQIDLAAAAALTEFAHDPKALERIMKKGGGHWGYKHAIADEQARQATKDRIERLKAELVLAGVKVTARPTFVSEGGTAMRAEHLVDANGDPVDVEAVKTEPRFAAYISRDYYTPAAVVYCADPTAAGLRPAPDTYEAARAEREARHTEIEARRAAWESATGVRHEFLTGRFATAKAAKGLFRPALRDLAGSHMSMPAHDVRDLADAICGCPIDDLPENAGLDRLTRATVARWLADAEDNLRVAAFGRWGDFQRALAYLDLLVAEGYELAEIESEIHRAITEALAEEDDSEADEVSADEDDEDDEEPEPEGESLAEVPDERGTDSHESQAEAAPDGSIAASVPERDDDLVNA
ncbi:ParB/RepB/Spo0J family partition protein [Glycomyces salinus]|uniref:ParB/RepB/Spo0J family partition protein n=1 Tax=Glycomyces salinus TaxID=980294 RepID=UPI0018ED57F7|nr:ParB/RepB/Spo0J family partition protein [Glycomyces salinus]